MRHICTSAFVEDKAASFACLFVNKNIEGQISLNGSKFRLNDRRYKKRKQVWRGTFLATTNREVPRLASHTIINYLHSSTKTRHLKDSTFKHRFYERIEMIPTYVTKLLEENRDGRIELTERNNAFHNQFCCTKSSGGKFSRSSRFVTWTINSVVPMIMISPSRNRRGI